MKQLTSPATPYGFLKYFTENAGTGIHPCVVVEIVLKWSNVRTSTENVDMSLITPLLTTIQNVSSCWFYYVCRDERYKALIKTLDIPEPPALRHRMFYDFCNLGNRRILEDCISKGDGTPAQLRYLNCADNIKKYRQSVPAFTYKTDVFPPYGDTNHHWYIRTYSCNTNIYNHVSLITDSKEDILNYINYAINFQLHFVPLPGTLQ